MARATITKTTVVGPYPALPITALSLNITWVQADAVNKNQISPTGDDLILVKNTGASGHNFTLTSVADQLQRTGDVGPYALGAGLDAGFRFKNAGWLQGDGKIYLEADSNEIYFAHIALP